MFKSFNSIDFSLKEHESLGHLYGLLEDCTDMGHITDEQKQHREKCATLEKEFENSMDERQRKMFIEYSNNNDDEIYILTMQAFILGYKAATRLLIEGMK